MMHTMSEHPGPSSGLGPHSGLGPGGLGGHSGLGPSGMGPSGLGSAGLGVSGLGAASLGAPTLGASSLASSSLGASSLPGVLSFGEGMNLYEPQQRQRFIFKMPRVVPDQKAKFESEELFRRLSRESEVKYTGYRDRPLEERQVRFTNGCREGHTEIAFTGTGTNLQLVFGPVSGNFAGDPRQCDFDKEHGKVHLRSPLIMNGVCVAWRGWIDLDRLDGVGCLEYDEERAAEEDVILREQLERYNRRVQEFEEKHRAYRTGNVAVQPQHMAPHHHHHHHHHHAHHQHHPIPGTSTITHDPHMTHHRQDPEMEVRLRAY